MRADPLATSSPDPRRAIGSPSKYLPCGTHPAIAAREDQALRPSHLPARGQCAQIPTGPRELSRPHSMATARPVPAATGLQDGTAVEKPFGWASVE